MGIPRAEVPRQIWVFPGRAVTPVEMCAVDSNFPRASFPPGEFCGERQDYIRRASLIGSPVCTRTVTGSLLFGSPHRLVRGGGGGGLMYATLLLVHGCSLLQPQLMSLSRRPGTRGVSRYDRRQDNE